MNVVSLADQHEFESFGVSYPIVSQQINATPVPYVSLVNTAITLEWF